MRDGERDATDDVVSRLRAAGCVFAEDEAALLAEVSGPDAELARDVARRVAGEPLEYVLGWAEFCGLRVAVEPGVFVPRRRTEFLVGQAVALARPGHRGRWICAVARAPRRHGRGRREGVELHATDIEPAAVRCARRNLAAAGGRVYEGDLFEPLPAGASRARRRSCWPTCRTSRAGRSARTPPEARDHEPRRDLDGGPTAWRCSGGSRRPHRVARARRQASCPRPVRDSAPAAVAVLAAAGLAPRVAEDGDLEATVVVGTRRA